MNLRYRLSQFLTLVGIIHGGRAFSGPLQANISLTNLCNIRCIHCYFYSPYIESRSLFELKNRHRSDDKYRERLERSYADYDTTRALIEKLISMGTRTFIFTGKGEPFLHKNILDFAECVKLAGGICTVTTNGTLLDRTTIDELIKLKFDALLITTMAGTGEIYSITHPGATDETFENLKNNLLYLAEQKVSMGVKMPKLTLVCVVIMQNCESLFSFAEFARLVRADSVLFRPVDDLADAGLSRVTPKAEQDASVREQLIEVKAYLESNGISHNISNFLKVFKNRLDTTALYQVIPCYYGWLSVRVAVNGLVYPCCGCNVPLGDIYRDDFQKIWSGDIYRRFRKEAIEINSRRSPVKGCGCNSCPHYAANLGVYRRLHPLRASL